MAKSLYDIAVESNALSMLCEGREKISNEDIKKYYPKGFHVENIDFIEMLSKKSRELQNVAIIHIKEEPKKFAYCGSVVTEQFMRILKRGFEGDLTAFRAQLKRENLYVKLVDIASTDADGMETGNVYTNMEFIK